MHFIPTLIIGGGIAGSSLACALADRGAGEGVAIVDIDLFGKSRSSATSGGGVQCFSPFPLDIRLSIASIQFLRRIEAKIDFRRVGSLRLCDPKSWQAIQEAIPEARVRGISVNELTPLKARSRYAFLGDVDDLAGAIAFPLDGYLSLHKLRMHYLDHAQAGHVTLMDNWQVSAIEGHAAPFRVTLRRVNPRLVKKALIDGIEKGGDLVVQAGRIVNAGGSWAGRIARLYGRELPVVAVPRQMFLVRQPRMNLDGMPIIVDEPNDTLVRQGEFDRKPCVLIDAHHRDAAAPIDFAVADYARQIEPRVVKRFPLMAEGEVVRAWAAHDETSPDGRAVVGAVPGIAGLFNFSGISARTMSQCHSLADAMAERLTREKWPADLDLEELNESRFGSVGD